MYASEALDDHHELGGFDCGNAELNHWLVAFARTAEAKRISRTFVWIEGVAVVAYYSLSAHLLRSEELPARLARGAPRQIPSVLLGRLALNRRLHGDGHGGALLADALARIIDATADVAARFVVVDAIDASADRFYRHHGFTAVPGTNRLVQKVSDVAAALRR